MVGESMAQFCILCGHTTNCTDDCDRCLKEEENESQYPCDYKPHICPFDAFGGDDCRRYCGLGVDE
jgi:hypothetical protein